MKIKRIIIKNDAMNTLFKGPLLNLTYHKESIKKMCIELFDDENPCIIHESFVIQKFAEQMEQSLLAMNQNPLIINEDILKLFPFVNLNQYIGCMLELEVNK